MLAEQHRHEIFTALYIAIYWTHRQMGTWNLTGFNLFIDEIRFPPADMEFLIPSSGTTPPDSGRNLRTEAPRQKDGWLGLRP